MRALYHVVGVSVLAKLGTEVFAHPGCFTSNETPTLGVTLDFCEIESDGACCTPTQEGDALGVYQQYGDLTGDCADMYKQVRWEVVEQCNAALKNPCGWYLFACQMLSRIC